PLLIELCEEFEQIPDRLRRLMEQHQCQVLHFNEDYGASEQTRDDAVARTLTLRGFRVRRYPDQAVIAPGRLLTKAGAAYTVFTPFRRAWQRELAQFWPVLAPAPPSQSVAP